MGPVWVHQLPGDVTLAYDLRLMHSIPHYKYLSKDYNFLHEEQQRNSHVSPGCPKKRRLGHQNGSKSLGPEKLRKIVSCVETKKLKETIVGPQVE